MSFVQKYFRRQHGSMALQFAFVAPVIVLVLTALIDLALLLFNASHIEGAAHAAARQIRTGAIQEEADPQTAFENLLCQHLAGLVPCDEVSFDVRVFDGFATVAANQVSFGGDGQLSAPEFTPGESEEIIAVTVLYYWKFLTPQMGRLMSGREDNRFPLVSVAVFQNEPFESFD